VIYVSAVCSRRTAPIPTAVMRKQNEMFKMFSLVILNFLEVYGSKISQWAWRKRWNRKNGLSRQKENK